MSKHSCYIRNPKESGPGTGTTNIPADWMRWKKRIPITVNLGSASSEQTNFSMLIKSTFADLIGHNIKELRFASEEGILLDYEIMSFSSATGQLIAWVKQPTIIDLDKTYLYYDIAGSVDGQNVSQLWGSQYQTILHMNEASDSSTVRNSVDTSDSFDLFGSPGLLSRDGKSYRSIFLDRASGTYLENNISERYGIGINFSISAWIKTNRRNGMIFDNRKTEEPFTGFYFGLGILHSGKLSVFTSSGLADGVASASDSFTYPDDNQWHHVAVTYDGVHMVFYIDGERTGRTAISGSYIGDPQNKLKIGKSAIPSENFSFSGYVEELRLSKSVKSYSTIISEFKNQNNPDSFYSIGEVEIAS